MLRIIQMNQLKILLTLLLITPILQACSVGMAATGKKDPDLSVVKKGASRTEVEFQLGSPISVATLDPGKTQAKYQYEIGNEPSAGRAVAHGAMDVLTLGLWEVVGTPVELASGDKLELTITYNQHDEIEHIGRVH